MKHNLKNIFAALFMLVIFTGCEKDEYSLGDLTAPTNIVINTIVAGQDANNPDGDGSGLVYISVTADNGLVYKIDYDASNGVEPVVVPGGTVNWKYTTQGINTYTITAVVYGKGGSASTATTTVTVRSDFSPEPDIVTRLTGNSSKTWQVDKSVPGHMGVGPYAAGSVTPEWWSAAVNEKVACCNCFYTASFTFTQNGNNFSLQASTPDGAFTKTGALTTLPGIPAGGDEGCYSYGGGTSSFSFIPASSGVAETASTQTSIMLSGNSTFIGYGAVLKEYEILEITDTYLYLRVQGTETGNAWYLKLKAL